MKTISMKSRILASHLAIALIAAITASILTPIGHVTDFAAAGVAALCIILSILLTQVLINPIKHMRQLSRHIAKGDLEIRLKPSGRDELGQLADDINSMASRLQDLESARRDFMANVSHELRSPVSNIRITSEVLERRADKLGDDSAKLFRTVIHETERLEMLINEFMELSAIDSGDLRLEKEIFNLGALLQVVIDAFTPRIQQKQLTVGLLVDPELEIVADRLKLKRAVRNLLDNAVKFTPSGGQIVISVEQKPSMVIIGITDSGEGIAPKDLARVFERFYRADKARGRKGGSGIGLSIVHHIAEAHGGKVEAFSREGQGSTFMISLPLNN